MPTSNNATGKENKVGDLLMYTDDIADPFKKSSRLDRSPSRDDQTNVTNGEKRSGTSEVNLSKYTAPQTSSSGKVSRKRKPEALPVMENLELTPGADHEYAVCLKSLFGEIYTMRQAALAAVNLGQMEPFITRAVKTIQRIGTLSERVLIIDKASPSLKNSNQGPCLTCNKSIFEHRRANSCN